MGNTLFGWSVGKWSAHVLTEVPGTQYMFNWVATVFTIDFIFQKSCKIFL